MASEIGTETMTKCIKYNLKIAQFNQTYIKLLSDDLISHQKMESSLG